MNKEPDSLDRSSQNQSTRQIQKPAPMNNVVRPKPLITILSSRNYASATLSDQTQTLLRWLSLSPTRQSPKLTRQCHARILVLNLHQNPFLATKLVLAYAKLSDMADSRRVFDAVELKNVFLWNTLISSYVKSFDYAHAFELFHDMSPDEFTLSTLAKASRDMQHLAVGESVHAKSVRAGFCSDVILANSLVLMYFKCGEFGSARNLFDEIPIRNAGSWNALISGYLDCEDRSFDSEILEAVKSMQIDGVKPDAITVSSLLPLCGHKSGREIHCYVVKNHFGGDLGSDLHLGSCLIDMYAKSNRVHIARTLFDKMTSRNVYSWTAIISCYANNGDSGEALSLFRDMQVKSGVEPNRVSLVTVLPVCNSTGSLRAGREIHGFTIRKLPDRDVPLCNALIDMYSKCGSLDLARRVFDDDALGKDTISWSAMICGYGVHGRGDEAVSLYREMIARGLKPDAVTIIGILSACTRSGLVEEGLGIYTSAISDHAIDPTVEICACVVDMLGRSGKLDRALDFIEQMPVKPGPSVWGALLNAAVMHGNLKAQELCYTRLTEIEPDNASNFIALSNLYASSGFWDKVAGVRAGMRERGLRKEPGFSWISIESATHCFCVADVAHPCSDLIYQMLERLRFVMRSNHSFDLEVLTL